MSRPLRVEFAGALYHVTARGNAREDIFRDDADRATFVELLGREIAQQRWRLYAYCLMSNHSVFRAKRCSTAAMRRRTVARFICCGGWRTNRSPR